MQELNDAQQRAVEAGDGPTLVLAGAGSGKTRVIVERLAWLVGERGVDPRNLLALTFTNRAADEMRSRVAARLETERLAAWVGTFHSFGLFILRREMDTLGRSKNFTVFDDADQLALMKRLVQDLPARFPRVSPREALQWISGFKQGLRKPDFDAPPAHPEEESFLQLWGAYHAALERARAVDFDDLLVLTARLLDEHPDVRERYARRYRYIHVDEYQDTNRAQYWIARRLSEAHGNIFVVGDEDQSIYSWRGADLNNILDFAKDFPGAQTIRLEQSYRNSPEILAVANAVVANNVLRLGKTLWTKRQAGPPVEFYWARDGEDEARYVADRIAGSDAPAREVAVLYRTNGQSRLLEEAFRRRGLTYKIVGGVEFYGRKEIKDLLAYLRLLVNPADDVSLRRVLNVPPRGVGGVTLQRLEEYATQREMPLFQVLRETEHDQTLPSRARASIAEFVRTIDDLTLGAQTKGVRKIVDELIDRTGYREYLRNADEKDWRTRVEMVDEFVSACAQFDDRNAGGGLLAFLQELALLSDVDEWNPQAPGVTLMTIHMAKGLEFDRVFLIGLEEGLLPHASALDSDREVEEERRLCYVAMTRARNRLTLTAARARTLYGERRDAAISRFVGEVPRDALEWHSFEETERVVARPARSKVATEQLKMGTKVWHPQFGHGVVMYTKGSGDKLNARIRFNTGRIREFRVSMSPLEVVDGQNR
jgi:DNA helicase-2/ATP-dependent DNA helicase PcrA